VNPRPTGSPEPSPLTSEPTPAVAEAAGSRPERRGGLALTRYCFTIKPSSWESIILLLTPPTCKAYPTAILLHDHCAIHAPPPTPPLNAIHHTILAMAKGRSDQRRVSESYKLTTPRLIIGGGLS